MSEADRVFRAGNAQREATASLPALPPSNLLPYGRGGGPRLDIDEWTLLTHIFLSNGSVSLGANHPDIQAISPILTRLAAKRGASRKGQTLRSSAGLARRIGMLRRLAWGEAATVPIAARAAYELYADNPVACASRAAELLDRWGMRNPVGRAVVAPARGPKPFDGLFEVDRTLGPISVYLFVLDGPGSVVLPDPANPALRFIKIGITSDLARRTAELNQAFPPGLDLVWCLVHHLEDLDPAHAYAIEQALLRTLFEIGATIGGEFAAIDPETARSLLEEQRFLPSSRPLTGANRQC